jgi:SAM-dependent methyltransferase
VPLERDRLHEIVTELSTRPGHEKVRALVYGLLVDGLGASSADVDFERPVPEVHGRIDALLGQTVFEFKRDLRRERIDAEEELTRYLTDRERQTGLRFVGIATDGAEFAPYELRQGQLTRLPGFNARTQGSELLVWLDAAVAVRADLAPTPDLVRRELGRDSVAFERVKGQLETIWKSLQQQPDVRLRRRLWSDLLSRVYGGSMDADDLFFQHTYLTIVAKSMATQVLGAGVPRAADLLAGTPFTDAGIHGAVESDFFDWVLDAAAGVDLVERIAQQVSRFRLADVQADVLKGLYESLIDPEQRHDLGEYYTPDWLAARVCERAITDPLAQRVLDPACGSGTFLFHAVRLFLAAADAAGIPGPAAVSRCCASVLGIDVHPVAAIIARVTYLLALGEERLRERPPITVPVYVGDSLQWNTRSFMGAQEISIVVPDETRTLVFPFSVTSDPGVLDSVIETMLNLSEQKADEAAFRTWLSLARISDVADVAELVGTYILLRELRADERDHIWGYVARNLSRPIWLSSPGQRPDVIVGNPPWLSYRYMAPAMQQEFWDEAKRLGVWVGGAGRSPHQDLSGYFYARCIELYLDPGATVALVMPLAALSRHHFEKFLGGLYSSPQGRPKKQHVFASVKFLEAWGFDERVKPLFPVPSCVLIGRTGESGSLPDVVTMYEGVLPRRDATPAEANAVLQSHSRPWTEHVSGEPSSYEKQFRQGAIVLPRVLFVVERVPVGRLGGDPSAPVVRSRRTALEKAPWRGVPALEGPVEVRFLRPLYLGESIAPFRLLEAPLAVIPWDDDAGKLLGRDAARDAAQLNLSRWLTEVEGLWKEHGKRSDEALVPRLDFFGQLSAQLPIAPFRVVYGASGSLPAAAILRDQRAIVEHKLYWTAVGEDEAHYLEAILNSETARAAAAHLQSRGQWGARDFDKVILGLPIPDFQPGNDLHMELVAAARRAEIVALTVDLPSEVNFIRARGLVRGALERDGIALGIDRLVAHLLQP